MPEAAGRDKLRRDRACRAVDLRDLRALVERDAMLHVPTIAMDHDLLERFLARENRRQHDAVVVYPRLGIEDRDVVGIGRLLEQAFQRAPGRHAVADDDQLSLNIW